MRILTNKKLVFGILSSLLLSVGFVSPVLAAGPVAGTWSVVDHGQGCWAGGNLLVNGGGTGGGECAFQTPLGEEVASIKPVSWTFTDSTDTAVNLCANFTGKKGPVFPIGVPILNCVVVPVGTSAPVNLFGDTYGKVNIF